MRLSTPARMATSVAWAPIVRAARHLPVSTFKRYIKVSASERRWYPLARFQSRRLLWAMTSIASLRQIAPGVRCGQWFARSRGGIDGVALRAAITALLHHVTIDRLRESFLALKRKVAPEVAGLRWRDYEAGLKDHLQSLHARVQ